MKLLDRIRPHNLLLISRWSQFTEGYTPLDGSARSPLVLADDSHWDTPPTSVDVIARNLQILAEFCRERDIELWIMKQVPETGEKLPSKEWLLYSMGRISRPSNKRTSRAEHRERQAKANTIFESLGKKVHLVDVSEPLFDENDLTINYRDGRSLYRDNDHLSRAGGDAIKELLIAMFREMKTDATK